MHVFSALLWVCVFLEDYAGCLQLYFVCVRLCECARAPISGVGELHSLSLAFYTKPQLQPYGLYWKTCPASLEYQQQCTTTFNCNPLLLQTRDVIELSVSYFILIARNIPNSLHFRLKPGSFKQNKREFGITSIPLMECT